MRWTRDVMGMPVTIESTDPNVRAGEAESAFEQFHLLDAVFSLHRADSEVSRIRRRELDQADASPMVLRAAALCRSYEISTQGFFAAGAAETFDPTGLVKAWAIDRACSALDAHGWANFFVDAGGDVQTRGQRDGAVPWRVGIRHPVERDCVVRVIECRGRAVATSGTYEKGLHVVNPTTGTPAARWISFTVTGPDIVAADVYATAAMAMGDDGLEFIARQPGYEAYAIGPDLRASRTAGFDSLCAEASQTSHSAADDGFAVRDTRAFARDSSRP